MIQKFMGLPEARHLPFRERVEAAYHAQRKAFTHWQVWAALLNIFASTWMATWLTDSVVGRDFAGFGFVAGSSVSYLWFSRIFFRFGHPYFRAHLERPS